VQSISTNTRRYFKHNYTPSNGQEKKVMECKGTGRLYSNYSCTYL